MRIRVLEPEGFPEAAIERLRTLGEVFLGKPSRTPEPGVEAVFVRLAERLDAAFHRTFPDLKWIVSPTTGLNHIDLEHFAAGGVEVVSLRGRAELLDRIHATAEHTLALALALLRDIPGAAAAVREGRWDRYPHKGNELHGKRVLLLGYGRIGRMVAPLYRAFGCTVRAHDRLGGRVPDELRCRFPEALAETDLLSVHLPLEPQTRRLLGAGLLGLLPGHAVVVNTARGEVIDQEALLSAIEQGALAGAALDVLWDEPDPVTPELRARLAALGRRLVVTPHIGGFTDESLAAVEAYIADVFIAAVDGCD